MASQMLPGWLGQVQRPDTNDEPIGSPFAVRSGCCHYGVVVMGVATYVNRFPVPASMNRPVI